MPVINTGTRGEVVKRLQRSVNRRLEARGASDRKIKKIDGVFGAETREALRYASYLLGSGDLEGIKHGSISDDEQRFVRNPGLRTPGEKALGKKRTAAHKAALKKQKASAAKAKGKRAKIVAEAEKAAANYRKNPGAYHYLAGGKANTVYLAPTPRDWRSDCSQFVSSVYKGAGVPSPASPLDYQWASTYSIVKSPHAKFYSRKDRKPGMLGMYGSRTDPHHVELWCGTKFIGHGSQPIDSITPGEPDYYVDFDFLN